MPGISIWVNAQAAQSGIRGRGEALRAHLFEQHGAAVVQGDAGGVPRSGRLPRGAPQSPRPPPGMPRRGRENPAVAGRAEAVCWRASGRRVLALELDAPIVA